MQKFTTATTKSDSGDDMLDDDFSGPKRPKFGFTRVIPVKQHNFYIYSDIGPPENYIDLIQTIRTADVHDQIYLHLNTGGGHLDTGIAIVSAIAECQGTVTTVLDSLACSMGAILFLAGHQYIVHDCAMMMFHTFNGGFIGKSSDVDKQVQAYKRQYAMLVKKTCSKFLTADEIKRIDNGEELWFASDLIGKRLRVLHKEQIEEAGGKSPRKLKKGVTPIPDTLIAE
jgi:ATP-dependent protease ClpP protease subunit